MKFATLLRDGHTAVVPPWMFVRPGHDHPPVELQVAGDRFLVARTGETEEIKKKRIVPGTEVLEIGDHVPSRRYLQENVLRFNSYGTPQANEAIGLVAILRGPKGSQVPLKVRDADGTLREVSLTADLDIDRLDLPGIHGLILDVRYNSGGNSVHAYSIVGCLTDQPLPASKWKGLSYVPAYRSWGRPAGWAEGGPSIVEPRAGKTYTGPLVVLTGPGTFSAAEDFLVPLQYSRRAVLVGEKTAGSTGNPVVVPLPGGGMFRVVSKRDTFPDGREFVGIGISPDVEVHPTVEDVRNGTDSVLQKGIEVIRNWASYR